VTRAEWDVASRPIQVGSLQQEAGRAIRERDAGSALDHRPSDFGVRPGPWRKQLDVKCHWAGRPGTFNEKRR
tara:strand:+ start:29219 stop:29434 length:216 start_codon:yes stop_codon:yes gene_type:complete